MPKNEFTKEQIDKLVLFADNTNIRAFNRALRNLLLECMADKNNCYCNREDFISDMINLFRLLDALETSNK